VGIRNVLQKDKYLSIKVRVFELAFVHCGL